MKKLILTLLTISSINAFAATTASSPVAKEQQNLNVNKLECHCEKHKMIFELKDGESIAEMSKHCMINEDKKQTMVKFFDDNSQQTVKCQLHDNKLILKSCQAIKHDLNNYKKSSKMSASEYTTTSAH